VGGIFNALVETLATGLRVLHGVTGSYLLAIVLLTVLIKAALHPLTRKQLNSMKAMQALTPQMEVLRRKFKDDPKQLNAEIMNLYRTNKVNPFGGCLPLLLQLPILYALFALLRRENVFGGETLFGVSLERYASFSMIPDHPLLALIPILVGLTTYWQQRMSITDPQQARMFVFMPIFVAYTSIAGWFPLGLSVYWIISTAAYIVEYYLVVGPPRRIGVAPPREQRRPRSSGRTQPKETKG
jgi:YidC/Oxa1 family membrane protein insertase